MNFDPCLIVHRMLTLMHVHAWLMAGVASGTLSACLEWLAIAERTLLDLYMGHKVETIIQFYLWGTRTRFTCFSSLLLLCL